MGEKVFSQTTKFKIFGLILIYNFYTYYVEPARNLLANEALHKLFGYTRLKSDDVVLNVAMRLKFNSPPILCFIPSLPLAVTKLGFCTLNATGKQITCRL